MNGLRSAITFLTVLPVGSRPGSDGLASARGWFPAVGLLLGVLVALLDVLIRWGFTSGSPFDPPIAVLALSSVVIVAALGLLTRALHLDGFMDACDALLGGSSPGDRMRILKDPNAGSYAVVGVVCLLLLKIAAVSLLVGHSRMAVLILTPCLSRWAMLLTMDAFPYLQPDGLGAAFLRKRGRGQLAFGSGVTVVAGLCLAGPWSLLIIAFVGLVAWLIGVSATRLLGGVTGDIYGAVNEIVETATLLAAALLAAWAPSALGSPFIDSAGPLSP